ncbi:PaaI family thioesterase [Rhodococcus chondri]|uniref:Medium/long-chain acyl-CoA thioesterase YigI n=1 Tax=Rhodococcus chondri TaxID=3065941 RepID=A0ABU7JY64_9NOCA|nr:PaaI family thioesterase [Rhodococcus sp. CC-R104]MEE2034840.1 PaaI family thioesterase [Rhodococcus sp. CC-R104]
MPEIGFDEASEVLAAQPFSVLVGARLVTYERDRAVLEIPLRQELLQQFGFVHGGVLSYAADNAITFAAGTALGPSIVTTGFTIDYLRPAQGTLLRAEARVVESTKRRALCRCEIVSIGDDGTEKVCAAAQGGARSVDLSR